jgi:hypothetical protein
MAVNRSMFQENLHQRLSFHRAFKFTTAIKGDIQAANEADITLTIISVGLDGWACRQVDNSAAVLSNKHQLRQEFT